MVSNDGIPPGFRMSTTPSNSLFSGKNIDTSITFSLDLIATYIVFRDQVYNPRSVLYPSCGFDGSPTRVFNQVTFVDMEEGNEGCIQSMQEKGLNAFKQDIKAYHPQQLHDLLILMNPAIPSEWATRHLNSSGYIISNNYHGNATELYHNPAEFTLVGSLQVASSHESRLCPASYSTDLEGFFDPVANEIELRRYRSDYYDFLKRHFSVIDGVTSEIKLNKSFEEVWAKFRTQMNQGMPSKRVADLYVFQKK